MPQYTFLCSTCKLQFSRRLKLSAVETHACPKCLKSAPRYWEGQGFGFEFAESKGTAVANSGVTKHDYPTADIAVGMSSTKRWKTLHARNATKAQIREETGATALARKDYMDSGEAITEYKSLGTPEFKARKQLETVLKEKANKHGVSTEISKAH